ncbi:MAG: hypothetical protein AB9900_06670 [Humidesulfovibrio sp.]
MKAMLLPWPAGLPGAWALPQARLPGAMFRKASPVARRSTWVIFSFGASGALRISALRRRSVRPARPLSALASQDTWRASAPSRRRFPARPSTGLSGAPAKAAVSSAENCPPWALAGLSAARWLPPAARHSSSAPWAETPASFSVSTARRPWPDTSRSQARGRSPASSGALVALALSAPA